MTDKHLDAAKLINFKDLGATENAIQTLLATEGLNPGKLDNDAANAQGVWHENTGAAFGRWMESYNLLKEVDGKFVLNEDGIDGVKARLARQAETYGVDLRSWENPAPHAEYLRAQTDAGTVVTGKDVVGGKEVYEPSGKEVGKYVYGKEPKGVYIPDEQLPPEETKDRGAYIRLDGTVIGDDYAGLAEVGGSANKTDERGLDSAAAAALKIDGHTKNIEQFETLKEGVGHPDTDFAGVALLKRLDNGGAGVVRGFHRLGAGGDTRERVFRGIPPSQPLDIIKVGYRSVGKLDVDLEGKTLSRNEAGLTALRRDDLNDRGRKEGTSAAVGIYDSYKVENVTHDNKKYKSVSIEGLIDTKSDYEARAFANWAKEFQSDEDKAEGKKGQILKGGIASRVQNYDDLKGNAVEGNLTWISGGKQRLMATVTAGVGNVEIDRTEGMRNTLKYIDARLKLDITEQIQDVTKKRMGGDVYLRGTGFLTGDEYTNRGKEDRFIPKQVQGALGLELWGIRADQSRGWQAYIEPIGFSHIFEDKERGVGEITEYMAKVGFRKEWGNPIDVEETFGERFFKQDNPDVLLNTQAILFHKMIMETGANDGVLHDPEGEPVAMTDGSTRKFTPEQLNEFLVTVNPAAMDRLREIKNGEYQASVFDKRGNRMYNKELSTSFSNAVGGVYTGGAAVNTDRPSFDAANNYAKAAYDDLYTAYQINGQSYLNTIANRSGKFDASNQYVDEPRQLTAPKGSYEENLSLQAALVGYLGKDLGTSGLLQDGVDGKVGAKTNAAYNEALQQIEADFRNANPDANLDEPASYAERLSNYAKEALANGARGYIADMPVKAQKLAKDDEIEIRTKGEVATFNMPTNYLDAKSVAAEIDGDASKVQAIHRLIDATTGLEISPNETKLAQMAYTNFITELRQADKDITSEVVKSVLENGNSEQTNAAKALVADIEKSGVNLGATYNDVNSVKTAFAGNKVDTYMLQHAIGVPTTGTFDAATEKGYEAYLKTLENRGVDVESSEAISAAINEDFRKSIDVSKVDFAELSNNPRKTNWEQIQLNLVANGLDIGTSGVMGNGVDKVGGNSTKAALLQVLASENAISEAQLRDVANGHTDRLLTILNAPDNSKLTEEEKVLAGEVFDRAAEKGYVNSDVLAARLSQSVANIEIANKPVDLSTVEG
ncbi:MAG: hypothetical protein COV36_02955, partial [Alphaproteobacteria bacterium CG11_big_fil_rev_8_21_14_0_20_44_7]